MKNINKIEDLSINELKILIDYETEIAYKYSWIFEYSIMFMFLSIVFGYFISYKFLFLYFISGFTIVFYSLYNLPKFFRIDKYRQLLNEKFKLLYKKDNYDKS